MLDDIHIRIVVRLYLYLEMSLTRRFCVVFCLETQIKIHSRRESRKIAAVKFPLKKIWSTILTAKSGNQDKQVLPEKGRHTIMKVFSSSGDGHDHDRFEGNQFQSSHSNGRSRRMLRKSIERFKRTKQNRKCDDTKCANEMRNLKK